MTARLQPITPRDREVVRAWARLEAKSPEMAEDLRLRFLPAPNEPGDWRAAIRVHTRLAMLLLEVWRHVGHH